ncbi:cobalt-precorrin-6A reductase [Phycicoccus sp. CSK15P-2]|uniref:cobalt-precorrin-6A reductase n=1 Tax=Phycicoccus sp. CSK15P-2 TaxID=2807627 RepID=UPI0019520BD4|nr:cobalt-precorrin-6A reductase [Phycicoccus sp. CSK15P-2]MBM6404222.1 cobalt-precorrin-6A reductase [Phycicoccus sp. CSK15P-2]
MPHVPDHLRILVVGGTAEARDLASRLVAVGIDVTSSLAGRVSRPRMPEGRVRVGGFGGVDGLRGAIREHGWTHVVDATHPFAATMTEHAVAAASAEGVPLLRLARPGWGGHPDAGEWHWVDGHDAARDTASALGERPALTTGRQTLPHYRSWRDRAVLVRLVEPTEEPLPDAWTVVLDRGPYDEAGETALFRGHRADVLVTKDSGGAYTAAKLDAARALGMPVVVVRRPPVPPGVEVVDDVDAVLRRLSG